MSDTPLITLLTPVYHPDLDYFREMLDSVRAQSNAGWNHVLVLDGPHDDAYSRAVTDLGDDRFVVIPRAENGGISAASNDALVAADGTFVGLLDHDDTLADFAVQAVADAVAAFDDADVLYSDEDKLDLAGRRTDPFCKPQFSPEWLRCHMYLNHLGVYRRSLVEEVGGFRSEFDGAQDHDLALRTTERARRVVHIPRVLYHWRQGATSTAIDPSSKDWAYEAGVRAVQAALDRLGLPAIAQRRDDYSGIVHIEPAIDDEPLVSLIIPTAGTSRVIIGEKLRLIDICLRSIADRTTYGRYEIVLVIDGSAPPGLERELESLARAPTRFLRNHRPFSFSEACNLGADHAEGEVLVFLNDDTEVVTENWLERLVLFSGIDGVGAVGVKLLYSDGRIQHMGLLSRHGIGHRAAGLAGDTRGSFGSFTAQTNVISVTGACLAVRAQDFDAVGGFTHLFPLAFNDVDLCLKLYRAGLRTVLDPQTTLIHHESSSRNPAVSDDEQRTLFARWRHLLEDDPYDSPHTCYLEQPNMQQDQPPATFLMVKEMVGADDDAPRGWPPPD